MSERIFDRVIGIGSGLLGAALLVAATVHLRAPLPVPVMPAVPAVPVAVAAAPAAAAARPLRVVAVLHPPNAGLPLAAHGVRPPGVKPRSGAMPRILLPSALPSKRRVARPPTGSATARLALAPGVHAPAVHAARAVHAAHAALAARTAAVPARPLPSWYQPPAARKHRRATPVRTNVSLPEPPVGYDPAPSLATTSVDTAAATAVVEPAPNASPLPIFTNKRGR